MDLDRSFSIHIPQEKKPYGTEKKEKHFRKDYGLGRLETSAGFIFNLDMSGGHGLSRSISTLDGQGGALLV